MQHTPEPWEYDGREINGPWDGKTVPTVVGTETHNRGYESFDTLVLSPADARRIVACVNVLEGIPTEELELKGGPIQGMIRALALTGRPKLVKHPTEGET